MGQNFAEEGADILEDVTMRKVHVSESTFRVGEVGAIFQTNRVVFVGDDGIGEGIQEENQRLSN